MFRYVYVMTHMMTGHFLKLSDISDKSENLLDYISISLVPQKMDINYQSNIVWFSQELEATPLQ